MQLIKKIMSCMPVPGVMALYLLPVQLCYYLLFAAGDVQGYSSSPADMFSMLYGILSLYFFASFLELFTAGKKSRYLIIPVAIFTLWGLNSYQLSSGTSLDYSLVRDNIGISFSSEALTMISSPFSIKDMLLFVVFLSAAFFSEYRFGDFFDKRVLSVKRSAAALFAWILLVLVPVQGGDGYTLFVKSVSHGSGTPLYARALPSEYPYEKKHLPLTSISSSVPDGRKAKPNIFLILIESFNANFVEKTAPDGIGYTPNFNALINKGLYIDRFYGNSIQTCKGQAAVFYSILPSINGKIFVDYPGLNVKGFPSVLNSAGYETIFFQAFHNLRFDNTYDNMVKAGFSVVKSYAEFRRKEDRPSIWGWGVEDAVFYERFFEMLDSLHAKNPGKPVFAALMTIGTHIPCDGMPVEKRTVYKDPQNIKEKYSNALRLSDSQLPRFFELLKKRGYLDNSIIIITADHSFPMREHGIYNNEVCFYDEAFRIPFLIIWDGVIKPERIRDRAYSQIDIGPTIADMLGISEAYHNMTGISVFDRKSNHPVYLVQPYNGRFLQVVNYPFKYIAHGKTGREYLFDLENDPSESNNLMLKNSDYNPLKVKELRDSLSAIYLNQQLIETDRIRSR